MSDDRNDAQDTLTGLFLRRTFENRFASSIDTAQNDGAIVSIISIDIDHFKRVNDTQGHAIGDEVIKRVAHIIADAAGETGTAVRYGGEEFIILLPGKEREQAFLLGERVRSKMDVPQTFTADGSSCELHITLSGGVSAYPTDGRTQQDVLRKADQALYRAKDTGRNKICIAEEEKMAAKTSHFTLTQLSRLSHLAKEEGIGEAALLREALDDLLTKYKVCEIES